MKLLVFVVVVAVFAPCAQDPREEAPSVSIVASPQKSVPPLARVTHAFDLARRALGHGHSVKPNVVLMFVDDQTARAQGVPKDTDVMVVHISNVQHGTYYVWIVGDANDDRLATAAIGVLVREWELRLSKKEMNDAAHRVRMSLAGVISAQDLARGAEVNSLR